MLETHLCSLLSFSIKRISFPLDNVVLRNKFQVRQTLLLGKTGCTMPFTIEGDGAANAQGSCYKHRKQGSEVGINGWVEPARGLCS